MKHGISLLSCAALTFHRDCNLVVPNALFVVFLISFIVLDLLVYNNYYYNNIAAKFDKLIKLYNFILHAFKYSTSVYLSDVRYQ